MKKQFIQVRGSIAACFSLAAALAVACSVDSSGLVFDDDEFAKASGEDGGDDGSGGSDAGMGGETSSGGSTSTGGETGTGGGMMSMGGATAEGCELGSLRCDGLQVEVCAGDIYVAVGGECEFACTEGECTGECEPGTTECTSDKKVNTCGETGEWAESTCDFACVGDACGGVCIPSATQCGTGNSGRDIERCSVAGEWEVVSTCEAACTDGLCTGNCSQGDTQCNGNVLQTCTDDADWATATNTTCEFICDPDGGPGGTAACGGQCVPDEEECVGSGANQGRRTCNSDGQWVGTNCPFVCDEQGEKAVCTGVCLPGFGRCTFDDKKGIAVGEVCGGDGQWDPEVGCEDSRAPICLNLGTPAKPELICTECVPEQNGCAWVDGNSDEPQQPHTCNSKGQWVFNETNACDKGELCFESKCIRNCPDDDASGCLTEDQGWFCDRLEIQSCECDCRSGVDCTEETSCQEPPKNPF